MPQSHSERTTKIDGWEVVKTSHAVEREMERLNGEIPGGFEKFIGKLLKRLGEKRDRNGEYLVNSRSDKQALIVNIDWDVKQVRIMTVLPRGRSNPRPGTKVIMFENVQYNVIELDEDMLSFREYLEEMAKSKDKIEVKLPPPRNPTVAAVMTKKGAGKHKNKKKEAKYREPLDN